MCSAQYYYFVVGASRKRRFTEMTIFARMVTRKDLITREHRGSSLKGRRKNHLCSGYEKKSAHLSEDQCFDLFQGPVFNGRFRSIFLTAIQNNEALRRSTLWASESSRYGQFFTRSFFDMYMHHKWTLGK